MSKSIVHATSICARYNGHWLGTLLMGPSGAGKSDLALRALQSGFQLISDDYSLVFSSGGGLFATAPVTIAEKMEVRGTGILDMPRRPLCRIVLVAFLQTQAIERLPEKEITQILEHKIPTIRINPFEFSSVAKLRLALTRMG